MYCYTDKTYILSKYQNIVDNKWGLENSFTPDVETNIKGDVFPVAEY